MNTFINATFYSLKARICLAEWSNAPLFQSCLRHFCTFFKIAISFRRFCDFGRTRAMEGNVLNENLWPKLQLDVVGMDIRYYCKISWNFSLFLLNKNEEFHTFSTVFWPLMVFKTLFTYYNNQIKSKTSLNCNMSLK